MSEWNAKSPFSLKEWDSLMLSTLDKFFCRQHFEIFFLIFSEKQDLTFNANCLQWRQFACNVKPVSRKNKKTITNLLSAELAQRVVKVKK